MTDLLSRLKDALADRYAIEREIGAGGMATVYLAHDRKHRRNVAVKVLRPELAATLGPERFLREIEVATQLTHPHILPLHDSGEANGFLYYVMPFIEGESLRERLSREGSLPIADAVRIIREVTDALASAHRAGVVHRDIKPDNILLSQNHALVTDFGVAKAVSVATGRQRLTTAGVALGTPAYMAPEQAGADPNIDHRADIYAVGAVAYELLAGRPPFTGNTSQAILAAHVAETPQPVTDHRQAVPPALANLVMRCLEKNRADRWQTADELIPHLETMSTPSRAVTPPPAVPVINTSMSRPRHPSRGLLTAAGLVALIAVPVVVMQRGGSRDAPEENERILVAAFENGTGDPSLEHVGRIFADWLARGIQETGLVDVVDPRAAETSMEAGDTLSPRELAGLMGSGTVVSGVYYRHGDSLQIQANLVRAETGEVLRALEPVVAPSSDPLQAAEMLAQRVMGGVAAVFPRFVGSVELRFARAPRNYEAYREYLAGSEIFARGPQTDAILYMRRALAHDSTFFPAASLLATIFGNLGRAIEMDSIVEWVSTFRDRMTDVERLELDYLRSRIRGDWAAGFRAHEAIDRLIPPNAPYKFLLGYYAYHTNRLEYAAQVLDAEPRLEEWSAYWADLTATLHLLGRHERELEVAEMGRAALPDSRARMRERLVALVGLGRIEEVREAVDAILTFPSGAPGDDLRTLANEFLVHEHPDDASDFRRRGVAWYREAVRADPDNRTLRRSMAILLYENGDTAEARRILEDLANSVPDDVNTLGWLGVVAAAGRDSLEVDRLDRELMEIDVPYSHGSNTSRRAWIAAARGQRDRAVTLLSQAHREGFAFGMWTHRDPTLAVLHGYGPFEEFIRPRTN